MSSSAPYDDIYYYADNYNYSANYIDNYQLSHETSIIAGTLYTVTAALSLLLYVRILIIIYFNVEMSKLTAYRIMMHYGYADSLSLLVSVISGANSIALSDFGYWFAKICGAVYMFTWYAVYSLMLLLAFNRFFQILFSHHAERYFSVRFTTIWLSLCWLTSLPSPILSLTPFANYHYYPYWNNWAYMVATNQRRDILSSIDYNIMLAKVAIAAVLYATVIVYLIFQRKRMSKKEISLTVQTMIDVAFRCSVYIYHQFFGLPLNGTVIEFIILNYLLILINSTNPFIYLFFNKTLRNDFFAFVKKKKNVVQQLPMMNRRVTLADSALFLVRIES